MMGQQLMAAMYIIQLQKIFQILVICRTKTNGKYKKGISLLDMCGIPLNVFNIGCIFVKIA